MSRPAIEGVIRYANNRINQRETERLLAQAARSTRDDGPPSPKILRERQMWNAKCFKGGNQAQHAGDAIGQLWLLGMLDIKGYDETNLLSAARDWWRGREETFKRQGFKTARYERASRTSNSTTKMNKLEKLFEKYERFLLDAADFDRDCLHDLMETDLDGEMAWWASRIIQTELLRHIRLPLALLCTDEDICKLEGAKRAMLAMAGVEAMVRGEERDAA